MNQDRLMRAVALAGAGAALVLALAAVRSPVARAIRRGEPLTGIVMGTDAVEVAHHSDTLMFWRYDPMRGRVDLLSIPRDTKIDLPGYRFSRINEVFAYHFGVKRSYDLAAGEVMSAVTYLLKRDDPSIRPRHYLHVDYSGFKRIVDLLGGIRIHVDEPMHYDDNAGGFHIHLEPGDYRLDGEQALGYVRFRGRSGDRGRVLRQMEFLKALANNLSSPLLYLKAPRLLAVMLNSLHSNLRTGDVFALALETKQLRPDRINPWLLPGRPKGAYWEIDPERAALVLQQILGGAPSATAVPAAARVQPEVRAVTVKVWNGTRRQGLALTVARRLRTAGFDVLEWGNYSARQLRTRVLDRTGVIENAKAVGRALGTDSVFSDVDPGLRTDVEVVVGDDYLNADLGTRNAE